MSDHSPLSEEFNRWCVENHVEAKVIALPNPGDPYKSLLMLEFRSFSDSVIRVTQKDRNSTVHNIPARGTIQLIVRPGESLPDIEKVNDGA